MKAEAERKQAGSPRDLKTVLTEGVACARVLRSGSGRRLGEPLVCRRHQCWSVWKSEEEVMQNRVLGLLEGLWLLSI